MESINKNKYDIDLTQMLHTNIHPINQVTMYIAISPKSTAKTAFPMSTLCFVHFGLK